MMKATYSRKTFAKPDSTVALNHLKIASVNLPFNGITARAIIARRRNGAVVGTRHYQGAQYALPGGGLDDGESPDETILRELKEEQITLLGSDENWRERLTVDYFHDFRELAIWYVFVVDDADIGECRENVTTRWVHQHEDVWYPFVRSRILLELQKQCPELVKTVHHFGDIPRKKQETKQPEGGRQMAANPINRTKQERLNRLVEMYNRVEEIFGKSVAVRRNLELTVLVLSIITTGSLWLLITQAVPLVMLWIGAIVSTIITVITFYLNASGFNVQKKPIEALRLFREMGEFIARFRSNDVSEEEYWKSLKKFEYEMVQLERGEFAQSH